MKDRRLLEESIGKKGLRRSRGDFTTAGAVFVWAPATLASDMGGDLGRQHVLGVIAWLLLIGLLRRETAATRMQVAIVVVYATAVEYTFSAWLGAYFYRLDNVPAFVPPGHGLVYLAALSLGRSALARRHSATGVRGVLVVGGLYALWGLLLGPRPDVVGAFWYGCLVVFLWRGRAPRVYAAAFIIVTYLELIGTALGVWAWSEYDPVLHWIPLGNPPSGVAGAYCYFDAAALTLAPILARCLSNRPRPRLSGQQGPQIARGAP